MEFRKVELNNLARLADMFRLCLNRNVGEQYFVWKYKNNPAGEVIAFEAVDGETIAAFYGVIPEKYLIGNQEVIVYQSMDTMTHPNYQKRGLFIKLAKMTYDYLIAQHGAVYIVGIPGGNSFHGFVNKLGWKNIHNFDYVFLPRPLNIVSSVLYSKSFCTFQYTTKDNLSIDSLLKEKDENNSKIRPKLNDKILEWKVWSHPYKEFRVIKMTYKNDFCGICVFSVDEKSRIKIELFECTCDEKVQILRELCSFIFKTNKDALFLYTWNPVNPTLKAAYLKSWFLKNPFKSGLFSYKVPFITYSNKNDIFDTKWFEVSEYDIQPFMQD